MDEDCNLKQCGGSTREPCHTRWLNLAQYYRQRALQIEQMVAYLPKNLPPEADDYLWNVCNHEGNRLS